MINPPPFFFSFLVKNPQQQHFFSAQTPGKVSQSLRNGLQVSALARDGVPRAVVHCRSAAANPLAAAAVAVVEAHSVGTEAGVVLVRVKAVERRHAEQRR